MSQGNFEYSYSNHIPQSLNLFNTQSLIEKQEFVNINTCTGVALDTSSNGNLTVASWVLTFSLLCVNSEKDSIPVQCDPFSVLRSDVVQYE